MKGSFSSFITLLLACLATLIAPSSAGAYPISTFATTPVAQGGYVTSVRYFFSHQSNGPLNLNLNVVAPFFAYGITNRLAVLTAFPIVESDFNAPAGGFIPSSNQFGLADIPLVMRVDVFRKHWVAQNLEISLLGGLEIPTGDDPFSSHSVDIPLGAIFTWQSSGNEIDLDAIYQVNTEGGGISHGDSFKYDIAYTRRLLPWSLPEKGEPKLVWDIIFELNGTHLNHDSAVGAPGVLPDTGGDTLYFLSGFEWIFHDNAIQLGVQIPIWKDLNGNQLEPKFNILLNWVYSSVFF